MRTLRPLTYMQARFYDAAVGRFLSSDPIAFKDTSPFTFNRYAYGSDSPYVNIDPTGMQAESSTGRMECTGTHLGCGADSISSSPGTTSFGPAHNSASEPTGDTHGPRSTSSANTMGKTALDSPNEKEPEPSKGPNLANVFVDSYMKNQETTEHELKTLGGHATLFVFGIAIGKAPTIANVTGGVTLLQAIRAIPGGGLAMYGTAARTLAAGGVNTALGIGIGAASLKAGTSVGSLAVATGDTIDAAIFGK